MTVFLTLISDLIGNIALLLFAIGFLILAKPLRHLILLWSARDSGKALTLMTQAARHILSLPPPAEVPDAPPPQDNSKSQ